MSTKQTITSPLNSLNIRKRQQHIYDIWNSGSSLGQTQKCGGVNPVKMGSQPSPLDSWISSGNIVTENRNFSLFIELFILKALVPSYLQSIFLNSNFGKYPGRIELFFNFFKLPFNCKFMEPEQQSLWREQLDFQYLNSNFG